MDKNTITTIIPTYRRPAFLKRAIKSIKAQTYRNIRICVYDNNSQDETSSIVAELAKDDERISYFCHKENIGGVNNYLYGLQQIETPYFHLLSDDDVALPEFYESAIQYLQNDQKSFFFAGATIHSDLEGNIWNVPVHFWNEGLYIPPKGLLEILEKGLPQWTGIIFRKEALQEVGFIDLTTGIAADLDFDLRIAAQRQFYVSKKPCAIFFDHLETESANADSKLNWSSWQNLIKNIENIKELDPDTRDASIRILHKRFLGIVLYGTLNKIIRGDFSDALAARKIMTEYFSNKPCSLLFSILKDDDQILSKALISGIRMIARIRRRYVRARQIHAKWDKIYGYLRPQFGLFQDKSQK